MCLKFGCTITCANPDKKNLVDKGVGEDPSTTISGSSSVHQRNAIEIAFHWRANDGPTLNAGLIAS